MYLFSDRNLLFRFRKNKTYALYFKAYLWSTSSNVPTGWILRRLNEIQPLDTQGNGATVLIHERTILIVVFNLR